jgi:hypothetical protein
MIYEFRLEFTEKFGLGEFVVMVIGFSDVAVLTDEACIIVHGLLSRI